MRIRNDSNLLKNFESITLAWSGNSKAKDCLSSSCRRISSWERSSRSLPPYDGPENPQFHENSWEFQEIPSIRGKVPPSQRSWSTYSSVWLFTRHLSECKTTPQWKTNRTLLLSTLAYMTEIPTCGPQVSSEAVTSPEWSNWHRTCLEWTCLSAEHRNLLHTYPPNKCLFCHLMPPRSYFQMQQAFLTTYLLHVSF